MTIIEKQTIRHYHQQFLDQLPHNPAAAQGWHHAISQHARYQVLTQLLNFDDVAVLDIGCGVGDLKHALDARFHRFDYIGIDQQPEFIAQANKRFEQHRNTWFYEVDFTTCQLPQVDVGVACGALSYRCADPDWYRNMIGRFYEAADKAFAFNMLDDAAISSGPLIVAHNKDEVTQHCREVCPRVQVATGYHTHDFTVVMHKNS